MNLPPSIDNNTIETFRTQIKAFLKILMVKCDTINESYKNQQIKEYVRKRCEDFKDNPSYMIDSLIDHQKRKIIIDRVLINNNNNQELLVDPVQIKEAMVHHFQNCAGGTNVRKEIPQEWQNQYLPKSNINPDIYNSLMDPPSLNEWHNIIKNLPNDKAAGPSGITNEMIKHLGEKSSLIIFDLVCACIKLKDIPSAWREANIYPIPKPKDWNSDLSNTRPITLLETVRKAMVRIINDRLTKLMVKHTILKGNQFAALPGSSTFEPIRIINEIIEDAKEQKKEIWLFFQDLSKAYDRVNIFMLEKAFERLRLPLDFITLILNLFSNRKNRVFTEAGMTDFFDMLIGIDQGEVISPILWCIYYDPLLCEIEERKLGYNLRHNYKQNLYSDQIIQIEQHLSVSAFMDDTSWITESKQSLEAILFIADGFYQLNNIMINKQKSELLVKIPKNKNIYNNEVDLNFGNEQIKIQPKKYSESIRILGIWMNLGKKRNFIIQQAKDEVLSLCNIMKKKFITDKQLLYIYNTVIIPRIEYRTQLTFLTKKECDNISSPFRQLFKHKIHLSTSAPNAIINNRMIYNYRNLYEVQLQSKITNFYIQLNDKRLLGNITDIRLKQIQHNEWLRKSPLIEWPYNTPQCRHYSSFIPSMITLCHSNKFTFQVHPHQTNEIVEGDIEIRTLISNFVHSKNQLRNNSIMFLEQLTTLDGNFLLNWHAIKHKSFTCSSTRIPKWYKTLKPIVLESNDGSNLLKPQFINHNIQNLKGQSIIYPNLNNQKQEWVVIWNPIIQNPTFGKIIKKFPSYNQIIIEHWIINDMLSTTDTPIIQKCNGCVIHQQVIISGIISCTNIYNPSYAIVINTKKISAYERSLNYTITDLFARAKFIMKVNLGIIIPGLHRPIKRQPDNNFIIKFVDNPVIQNQLLHHQIILESHKTLEFYTDGSLTNLGTQDMSMVCAYIQTHTAAPQLKFAAKLGSWPSAARSELIAVVMVLLVSPPNADIRVYTDSKCTIDHYEYLISTPSFTSPRNIFKQNNNIVWAIFCEILETKKIDLKFIKVKAHDGNHFNEMVDSLAKNTHANDSPSFSFTTDFLQSLKYIPKWNNIIIEQHLRHFITNISYNWGFETWLNLHRNKKYRQTLIDWKLTFEILNSLEKSTETSFAASSKKISKIKFLIEELPTVEHIKKRRPDLYNNWNCPLCKNQPESFEHIWICTQNAQKVKEILYKAKMKLIKNIQKKNNKNNNNNKFSPKKLEHDQLWFNNQSNASLTAIDLIKGIIPKVLSDSINNFIKNRMHTKEIITNFINELQKEILEEIWKPRCEIMLVNEQFAGIDRKQKYKKKPLNYILLTISNSNILNDNLELGMRGTLHSIRFGGDWLGFIMIVN